MTEKGNMLSGIAEAKGQNLKRSRLSNTEPRPCGMMAQASLRTGLGGPKPGPSPVIRRD